MDSGKLQPNTNKDCHEEEVPSDLSDRSEDESSDSSEDENDKENVPLIKRNEISKVCEFCKHTFPKFGSREFKKHKPRCKEWHKHVEANDNKTCKLCEKTYKNNGLCLAHFVKGKCHGKKRGMICSYCIQDFTNDRNFHTERFEKHKEMCEKWHNHVIDKNTCDFCPKKFATYNKALWHVANQNCRNASLDGNEKLVCQTCKNDYSKSNLVSHEIRCKKWNKYIKNSKTKSKKICKVCRTKFKNYSTALRHMPKCQNLPTNLKLEGEANFRKFIPCSFCSKEITNRGSRLEIHQNYCPENPNRKSGKCPLPFESCTRCNKVLLKKGLAKHENHCGSNQKVPKILCQICNADYSEARSEEAFGNHTRKCQKWDEFIINGSTCKPCGKKCTSRNNVFMHLENEVCYNKTCSFCSQSFELSVACLKHEKDCSNKKKNPTKRANPEVKSLTSNYVEDNIKRGCRLLLHDISESKCGKKPCFQNQLKSAEESRLLMDWEQNLQKQQYDQIINDKKEENPKTERTEKKSKRRTKSGIPLPLSKKQKLKDPHQPEISKEKYNSKVNEEMELHQQNDGEEIGVYLFEHQNNTKYEDKIKTEIKLENLIVQNGNNQSEFQSKSKENLVALTNTKTMSSKIDDENEIQEIHLPVIRSNTKVQIEFHNINIIKIINFAKTSVTLEDVKPKVKQYLNSLSKNKNVAISDIAMYEFSKKTRQNGKEISEDIADHETTDRLPFYDGNMIALECWPKMI